MTYAYIYQAELLCACCAENVTRDLVRDGQVNTGDSDDFPQGPFPDGGGEADCPQHCGVCEAFLENPLTPDGYDYLERSLRDGLPYFATYAAAFAARAQLGARVMIVECDS